MAWSCYYLCFLQLAEWGTAKEAQAPVGGSQGQIFQLLFQHLPLRSFADRTLQKRFNGENRYQSCKPVGQHYETETKKPDLNPVLVSCSRMTIPNPAANSVRCISSYICRSAGAALLQLWYYFSSLSLFSHL